MNSLACRACGGTELTSVVDLGITPLSNAMVPFDQGDAGEVCFPLHAFVCDGCFLVQLGQFEEPSTIFADDYVYFSSYSQSWLDHAKAYKEAMTGRFGLKGDAHIAEIASNDGYLLRWFLEDGFKVTGVEPAGACARAAQDIGVFTTSVFFGEQSAKQIVCQRGQADLVAANNVLAHVPDLQDFVAGFRVLLKSEGVVTFEFPHLQNLMRLNQFDTIYHEHFSYLALGPVQQILAQNGLRVFDVEQWPTHGGSLRVFVCHENAGHEKTPAVQALLATESDAGLYALETYRAFPEKVRQIKDATLEFLIRARRDGKTVAAYGAAAKGATFLNYCGIGPEYVAYVVDRNPHKQKKFMPGVRIPVYDIAHLVHNQPDYLLVLPWNLREEIGAQLQQMGVRSKVVTAIPELVVAA